MMGPLLSGGNRIRSHTSAARHTAIASAAEHASVQICPRTCCRQRTPDIGNVDVPVLGEVQIRRGRSDNLQFQIGAVAPPVYVQTMSSIGMFDLVRPTVECHRNRRDDVADDFIRFACRLPARRRDWLVPMPE